MNVVCLMKYFSFFSFWAFGLNMHAQQYTGMSGLIHVPSAEMDRAGEARVGLHFLNKHFTPEDEVFGTGGRYNTFSYYLSITPFSWVEIGYTCTLMKIHRTSGEDKNGKLRLNSKDRYASIKLQPVKEGKWWPAIAVGANDPFASHGSVDGHTRSKAYSYYFSNYYVAVTKHMELRRHVIGVHLNYRYWKREYNQKWNGLVGGITYQPSFQRSLRLIAEYTGNEVNVGFDWDLWKHLLIQSSLQNGKYFSCGVCFHLNLL